MSSAAGLQEEPILSRFNRLDHILKQLEDRKSASQSPKSSYASTNFSSSGSVSPDSLEKQQRYRPVNEVLMEVEQKGTLIQRLIRAEDRIFKLCLQLEDDLESKEHHEKAAFGAAAGVGDDHDHHQKKLGGSAGLKKLVKSCVGKSKKKKTTVKNRDAFHA